MLHDQWSSHFYHAFMVVYNIKTQQSNNIWLVLSLATQLCLPLSFTSRLLSNMIECENTNVYSVEVSMYGYKENPRTEAITPYTEENCRAVYHPVYITTIPRYTTGQEYMQGSLGLLQNIRSYTWAWYNTRWGRRDYYKFIKLCPIFRIIWMLENQRRYWK